MTPTDRKKDSSPGARLHRATEALIALSLAGMVLAVFVNVVLRYVFDTGIVFYEELSRLLFVWLVSIGAVLASVENKHLGFDMVVSRLKGVPRLLCNVATRVAIAGVLLLVVRGSWDQVIAGMDSRSTVIGYPLALAAASTLVLAVGMLGVLFAQTVLEWRAPPHQAPDAVTE
ncbi:TRAP transporter small permease [Caldimonas tepidiphila]|uniref:TRAP transporter small permease n=1 Tax=Caldimonas tepidiphila TaxID=2315841 RepID=UPI000E5A53E5|nr:TRAP transporter small permease [Caldimonas tepidiphila]